MRLKDAQIRALAPPEKPYKLFDGGGLYLHVTPSGMYWRYRYRFGGKDKVLAIGVYPKVSLKEARLAHMSAKTGLAEEDRPQQPKKALKTANRRLAHHDFRRSGQGVARRHDAHME